MWSTRWSSATSCAGSKARPSRGGCSSRSNGSAPAAAGAWCAVDGHDGAWPETDGMTTEEFEQQQKVTGRQLDYIRFLALLHECEGAPTIAAKLFATRYPRSPNADLVLKTATAPGTTVDATWAGPLAPPQVLAEAFLGYVRPQTVVARLGLRRAPF